MNDDRVFRKKEDHRAVNACVQQVIDLSGSMGGRKIQLALASAYTIADALDRINVPNIITGFTTFGSPDYETMSKRGFTRFEALMLPIIKKTGMRKLTHQRSAPAWAAYVRRSPAQ